MFEVSIKPLNRICIYVLFDPSEGVPKYIGSTESPDKRFKDHCVQTGALSQRSVNQWIIGLRKEKREPVMLIIDSVPRAEAEKVERHWIEHFIKLGVNLLNTKLK